MQAGVLNFEVKIFPYIVLPVEIAIVPSVKPATTSKVPVNLIKTNKTLF